MRGFGCGKIMEMMWGLFVMLERRVKLGERGL